MQSVHSGFHPQMSMTEDNWLRSEYSDDWQDIIVTASKVSTMPESRRMFSSEILAHEPGIENVTVITLS